MYWSKLLAAIALLASPCTTLGFLVGSSSRRRCCPFFMHRSVQTRRIELLQMNDLDDDQGASSKSDGQDEFIVRGTEGDEFPDEFWEEIETGKPSEWSVMKDLLGINVFTYVLASAIAFFLGMNTMFGQGWLGNTIGIKGTGTFTERSEKLPSVVDLGDDRYQI